MTKWSVVYRVPHSLTGSIKNQKYILHRKNPLPKTFSQIIPVKAVKLRTFSFLLPTFILTQVFYLSAPRPHLGVLPLGGTTRYEPLGPSLLSDLGECMGQKNPNGAAICPGILTTTFIDYGTITSRYSSLLSSPKSAPSNLRTLKILRYSEMTHYYS